MALSSNVKRQIPQAVVALLIVLSACSVAWANVRVAFDSTSLDFGSVAVLASKQLLLLVQDTATVPIEIDAITPTGTDAADFSVLSPQTMPVVLNSGQIATQIIVKFSPQALGTRTALLLIATSDGNVTIPLSGIGSGKHSSLSWSIESLNFGTISPDGERDSTIELYSTGTDSSLVSALVMAAADTSFVATIINHSQPPFMLPAGDSVAVRVAFRGLPLTGLKDAQLSATGSTLNTPSCDLFGDVEYGAFEVLPASMNFGSMFVGQIKDSTILVIDIGSLDLIFEDMSLSPAGDDFTIINPPPLPYTLRAGDTLRLTVRANPGKNTSHESSLQALSFSSNTHLIQAHLSVNATAVPLAAPSSQSLAYYCAASSAVHDTIPLKNTGQADIIATGVRFSDTAIQLHSDILFPDTLRSGMSQEISVVFDPSPAASDTQVLEFLGGNQAMFTDTIRLIPSAAHAAPDMWSTNATNSSQNIKFAVTTPLTSFGIDTVIVDLSMADTNVASIEEASITIDPSLTNVTITSIQAEQGGYRVTLTSPVPIVADSGMSLLDFSLDRFISSSDSTSLIASIETPERAGCIDWATDSLVTTGGQVCGGELLRSLVAGRPLIVNAVIRQNPVSNEAVSLTVLASATNNSLYEISNALGEMVTRGDLNIQAGVNNFALSLGSIPAGAYTLHLVPANGLPVALRFLKLE